MDGGMKLFCSPLEEARRCLSLARLPVNINTEGYVKDVRKLLKETGATLGDIKTSEKELCRLTRNGQIASAKKWLEFARDTRSHGDDISHWGANKYLKEMGLKPKDKVLEYLGRADTTPEEIGTSYEELENLVYKR